jgi:hypothetical protein
VRHLHIVVRVLVSMQSVGPFNAKRPFTRATARAAGISASRVVSGQYQKIFWDQYVSADMKLTTKLRATGALGIVPLGSHLSHYTAAALWGAVVPPDPDTHVWLSSPNGRLVREGLKCHYGNGRPQVTTLEGMLISTPEQSFLGSSELSMGWSGSVGPSPVGGEHDSQPIMIKVSETVGQPSDFLDDQVDGFGAAVGDP